MRVYVLSRRLLELEEPYCLPLCQPFEWYIPGYHGIILCMCVYARVYYFASRFMEKMETDVFKFTKVSTFDENRRFPFDFLQISLRHTPFFTIPYYICACYVIRKRMKKKTAYSIQYTKQTTYDVYVPSAIRNPDTQL